MSSFLSEPSPAPVHDIHSFLSNDTDDDDADTASQRSISLSSPPGSTRNSMMDDYAIQGKFSDQFARRESHPYTVDTGFESEDSRVVFSRSNIRDDTSDSSAAPSVYEDSKNYNDIPIPTYPPTMHRSDDRASVSSTTSASSRKTRPESLLVELSNGPIIHGVALVDFNHLIGPRIEYSQGEIFEDEEIAKILPFLALPDGAHLSSEDYSYFHLVPSGSKPSTMFGISCNQQIASSSLLVKPTDVTRSTVQKAVVVLASKPVFGPIRDKLGVVTTALFNQRDFTDASILNDFASSLELSLRGQLTESGFYMGTSLRELVHTFRQRTLVLVKALILQQKIIFYGHPVERLCTYQYSLVSLLPGLLQTLDDSGSPPLAARAATLSRPSSFKSSDPKSMMTFMGLPLDIFGKDSFFQPYLPLQQMDLLTTTPSWLCGSTNSIVTQHKDIDLLVNIETGAFEFRNPQLERSAALTAADRKWMDEIINDVNEGWSENPKPNLQFKGSDDYLRTKFEEYISSALSTIKYHDFVAKSAGSGVMITGGSGGDSSSAEDFNPLWIAEFRKTNAYEVWDRITDPLIFDLVEPRHPCNEKPSVVADIGLRLQEGIQDLKLEQQLAPAREAVSHAFSVSSTNFFKAVEGVRDRWSQRSDASSADTTPTLVPKSPPTMSTTPSGLRPFSLLQRGSATAPSTPAQSPVPPSSTLPESLASSSKNLASWGAGIGSFISTRAPTFLARKQSNDTPESSPVPENKPVPAPPPEPVPKPRNVPPPVHIVVEQGDEDKYAANSGQLTPQPFKSANTVTPRGTSIVRKGSGAGPPTPTTFASPPTPTAISTPASVPIPASEQKSEPELEVETTISSSPQPRARLARSNTASRRPTAGLWEDHDDVLDQVPEGLKAVPSTSNPWDDEEDHSDGSSMVSIKSRESRVNLKMTDDASSMYSKGSREEDLEDAYTGMAL